ncbi:hypothetical protein D3C85_1825990 [compost metagenome]
MRLLNRRDAVNENLATKAEMWTWYFWKKGMLKRNFMNMLGGKWKAFFLKKFAAKTWGKRRELPAMAPKSFNEQWRELHKNDNA